MNAESEQLREKNQVLRDYFLNAYLLAMTLELAEEEATLAEREAELSRTSEESWHAAAA